MPIKRKSAAAAKAAPATRPEFMWIDGRARARSRRRGAEITRPRLLVHIETAQVVASVEEDNSGLWEASTGGGYQQRHVGMFLTLEKAQAAAETAVLNPPLDMDLIRLLQVATFAQTLFPNPAPPAGDASPHIAPQP